MAITCLDPTTAFCDSNCALHLQHCVDPLPNLRFSHSLQTINWCKTSLHVSYRKHSQTLLVYINVLSWVNFYPFLLAGNQGSLHHQPQTSCTIISIIISEISKTCTIDLRNFFDFPPQKNGAIQRAQPINFQARGYC